jgi:3-hydroxybutyryl-CoA dehydratase
MAFTDSHLVFDDLRVGQEWESQGRTITEADVVHFAGLSGDYNPIHVDHHFAATTPFRRPIAHGVLIMAIGSGLGTHSPPMRTVAFLGIRELRFTNVVYAGDTIRVQTRVLSKELRGRGKRGEITWQRLLVNQDGKPVQESATVTLVECRAAKRDGDADSPPAAAGGSEENASA